MRRMNLVLAGAVCVALTSLARGAGAEDFLRPEWEVGQQAVSPQDLRVTAPPAAPDKLTIGGAVDIALQRNLGFRGTVQSLLAARSAWWTAGQRWDLELFGAVERSGNGETMEARQAGLGLYYSAGTGADISVTAELDKLDSEEAEQTLRATLRQPLLAGSGPASAAYEDIRRARSTYRAALLRFFVERQDLIERVISSYLNAVKQGQLVDIQDASVKLAEDSVNSAQSKFDAGLIPELDVTRAQLRQARERTSAVLQREAMRNAIDSLLLLLGLEVGGAPELVSAVSYQPEDTDLDAAVEQSLKLRPELRLADLSVEDREAALRINRSEARPTLDLLAGWGEARNGAAERDWNVGLELNVPISSRRLKNSVLQAEWNLLVERQDREDLQQQIVAQVRSQVRAAEAARASVEIDTESVELAKKSLYYAQRMWEEGLLTNRDLLDAQDEVTRSESGLVTSKLNYYLSVVRLHRAIGLNVAEDLPAEPDLSGSQADEEASVG